MARSVNACLFFIEYQVLQHFPCKALISTWCILCFAALARSRFLEVQPNPKLKKRTVFYYENSLFRDFVINLLNIKSSFAIYFILRRSSKAISSISIEPWFSFTFTECCWIHEMVKLLKKIFKDMFLNMCPVCALTSSRNGMEIF